MFVQATPTMPNLQQSLAFKTPELLRTATRLIPTSKFSFGQTEETTSKMNGKGLNAVTCTDPDAKQSTAAVTSDPQQASKAEIACQQHDKPVPSNSKRSDIKMTKTKQCSVNTSSASSEEPEDDSESSFEPQQGHSKRTRTQSLRTMRQMKLRRKQVVSK